MAVSMSQAQAELPTLLNGLSPDDEIVIVDGGRPVGKLVRLSNDSQGKRVLGRGRGKVVFMSDDESHLEDFKEYMP